MDDIAELNETYGRVSLRTDPAFPPPGDTVPVDAGNADFPACPDCFWAAFSPHENFLWDWTCNAPGVAEMLEYGNSFTSTPYAREFKTVCGAAAKFFVRRRPGNEHINACLLSDNYESLPEELRGNATQASDVHDPQ